MGPGFESLEVHQRFYGFVFISGDTSPAPEIKSHVRYASDSEFATRGGAFAEIALFAVCFTVHLRVRNIPPVAVCSGSELSAWRCTKDFMVLFLSPGTRVLHPRLSVASDSEFAARVRY